MGNATRSIITASGPRQNRKYSIVIPAAGIGYRMKKYGPKPLIKVGSASSIIDRQFKLIDQIFRWYEIILVTGFENTKVDKFVPSKIITVYNEDFETTNVVHSIGVGINHCTTDNIIVIYGDLVFNKFALNVPFDMESAAVIAHTMKEEEVGCNIDKGYVEQMFYGIPNKWAQILYLRGLELELMSNFAKDPQNSCCYGFEAINHIIANGGRFKAMTPRNAKAIDVDSSLDLKRVDTVI